MKSHIFLLTLMLSMAASADTIKKWTDEKGIIHYGDKKSAEHVKGAETLEILDTYDQQSYDEGMDRHKENIEAGDALEKERITEEAKRIEEEEGEKKSSPPARAGRTAVVPNPVIRSLPIPNRPSRPVNRPAQLPAKSN
ncbi:MAG: hypothetical protein ACN4GR_03710 [Arenicellales bacterium]